MSKPIWVILNGKVQTAECMRNGITTHDLMFKLRAAGIYEINSVNVLYSNKMDNFHYSIWR